MRSSTLRVPTESLEKRPPVRAVHLSPLADGGQPASLLDRDRAAQALAHFLDEAREILDRLEEAWIRRESARPGQRARRDILRFLAGAEDWVDFHDLPSMGPMGGRSGGRSLARRLADEGVVELHRDPTYPNILQLRITPEGRDELHRQAVEEAMGHLGGAGRDAGATVEDALRGLRRLAEVIGG